MLSYIKINPTYVSKFEGILLILFEVGFAVMAVLSVRFCSFKIVRLTVFIFCGFPVFDTSWGEPNFYKMLHSLKIICKKEFVVLVSSSIIH